MFRLGINPRATNDDTRLNDPLHIRELLGECLLEHSDAVERVDLRKKREPNLGKRLRERRI